MAYMPKSAKPVNPSDPGQQPAAQSIYMPASAKPVTPSYVPKSAKLADVTQSTSVPQSAEQGGKMEQFKSWLTSHPVWSDVTTDEELKQIADKHQIPISELQDTAAWFGATKQNETPTDLLKQVAGGVGTAVGLGVPQKLYRLVQEPRTRAALDELSALAEDHKSKLRSAVEMIAGGAVLPVGKLAIPAAAGLQAAAAAPTGEELKSGAIGATAGAALLGAGKLASKLAISSPTSKAPKFDLGSRVEEHLTKQAPKLQAEQTALKSGNIDDVINLLGGQDDVVKLLDKNSDKYRLILDDLHSRNMEPSNANIARAVAEEKLHTLRSELSNKVGAKDWETAVKEHGGTDYLVNTVHPQLQSEKATRELIHDDNLSRFVEPQGVVSGLLKKLLDGKPVARMTDRRLGLTGKLSMEQSLDDMSEGLARASDDTKRAYELIEQFDRNLKKSGISREQFDQAYRTGKAPENLRVEFQNINKTLLEDVNKKGAGIQARADYIRDQVKQPAQLNAAFKNKIDELSTKYKTDITTLGPNEWQDLKTQPDFQELVRGLGIMGSEAPTDASTFTKVLNKAVSEHPSPDSSLYVGLSSAKGKTGEIPGFMREADPIRGLESWTQATYRNLYTREPMLRLRGVAETADALDDDYSARYVRDLIGDINGTRRDTLAAGTRQLANKWKSHFLARGGKANEALADLPDFLGHMNKSLYSGILGGTNIKASLQNYLTPWMGAVPELGTTGISSIIRANKQAVQAATKSGGLDKFLAERGMLPAQIHEQAFSLQSDTSKLGKLNEKASNAMMSLFTASEKAGRAQAYFLGQNIGEKMAADANLATKIISRIPSPAYRASLGKSLRSGDVRGLQDGMSKYLNSEHLLNYNKANQSAFARQVGPLFAAFTKWPSNMAGKIVNEYLDRPANQAGKELLRKTLLPLALLEGVDRAVSPAGEESYREERVVGKDLRQMAPITSLTGVKPGQTPAIRALEIPAQIARGVAGDDEEQIKAGLEKAAYVLPFGMLLKLGVQDVPALIKNEKPGR